MNAPDDHILKTKEFIDDAQEIIARTNDLIAALNKLTSKNTGRQGMDPKQPAHNVHLQEELETLVQRYFPSSADPGGSQSKEINASTLQSNSAVRPGRFRPRI